MKGPIILLGKIKVRAELNFFLSQAIEPDGNVDPSSRYL